MVKAFKTWLGPALFLGAFAGAYIAAEVPWRAVLPVPDDNAYYYGALLAAEGRARLPIPAMLALHQRPAPRLATAENPGPPLQFTLTIDNYLTSEKPPGYIWWLALLRRLRLVRAANVVVFVLIFPAALALLRRFPPKGFAFWTLAAFLLTPLSAVFAYRTYMPTFLDAALPFGALVLFMNAAAGGRAPAAKLFACGLAVGFLAMIRVTNVVFAAAFGVAIVAAFGRGRGPVGRYLVAFGAPVVVAAAVLGVYNYMLFGSPLRSGYYVRFGTFNYNAVTTLWKKNPEIVKPETYRSGDAPFGAAEVPAPDVFVIRCVSHEAWLAKEQLITTFTSRWTGKARLRGRWAMAPPLGSAGVPAAARARLMVAAGERVLYDEEVAPPERWNDVDVEYAARPGERVLLACTFNDAGRRGAVAYVSPLVVDAGGRRYKLTSWSRPWFGLGGVVGRNLIGMYPYVLLAMPVILLAPFGLARARRLMPAGSFGLSAFVAGWTFLLYLQSTVYTPMATRYYAPALGPFALWAAYGLADAPRPSRWAAGVLLALLAVTTFTFALAFYGAFDLPWLTASGALTFFGR